MRAATRVRLPTIDATTCLGCYACVDACPYDVLEVRRYVAVVARPEACCGLTLCEQRCPNGSLRISEGEPVADLPRLSPDLESVDVPGLHLAGDVTGLPLIKNAIYQGAHAASRIAAALDRAPAGGSGAGLLDLLVVGAGPAGISAALRAKELGLRFEVLEQASVAQSIRSFPRGKLVFDQPLDLPAVGTLWLEQCTKEELLAKWLRIVRSERLPIREGTRLVALERDPQSGVFVATTDPGGGDDPSAIRARRVLLAIGQRGTPRRLDVPIPPELESRVHYHLADARAFAGKRVLVVGLGDVAMEAAIALARQPGTSVTVSYRGSGFRKGKARNIDELRRLADARRVTLAFESTVAELDEGGAHLATPGGRVRIECEAVLVLIGSLPPRDLLRAAGIRFTDAAS